MKYYPIHTHLHCSHEASASIASHMSHCKELGIAHMWTTEHDTRIGKPQGKYFCFFFPEKSLFVRLPSGRGAGFQEYETNTGEYTFAETENGIVLNVSAKKNERESLLFHTKGKVHSDPLFSRLMVELNADISVKAGGQVCVEFVLSAQPPTYKQARLCYVLGELPTDKTDEPVQYLPFPKKENGKYAFKLYEDVGEEIGGLDNALCNLNIIAENGAEIAVCGLDFYRELEYQKTRQAQISLLEKLGKKWGIKAFCGFEVTRAGNHKNCYSTKVPVIEYEKLENKVSNEQAVCHLQNYGAVYSWNHPLAGYFHLGASKEESLEMVASELIKNRVYGASMIEVGFPVGRGDFEAKDYLRLWDRLSGSGIMITGNGDSDNHHAVADGWTEANNFCSFAGLYEDEPPTEENFAKAFQRGSLWAGNPVLIKSLSFTGGGKEQGSLIRGRQVRVEFSATNIQCSGYAVCVSNGKEIKRVPIEKGVVAGNWVLSCEQTYNFARVEIYNEENLLIAFSNPIYLIDENTEIKER